MSALATLFGYWLDKKGLIYGNVSSRKLERPSSLIIQTLHVHWSLFIIGNSGSCRWEFNFLARARRDVHQSGRKKCWRKKECKQDRRRNGERHGEGGDEGCVVLGRLDENWRPKKSKSTCAGRLSINQSLYLFFFFFFFFFFTLCFLPHPLACSHLWFDSISLSWSGQSDCVHACAQVCDQRYITVANLLEIKSLWQTNLSIRTHSKRSGMERARERGSER